MTTSSSTGARPPARDLVRPGAERLLLLVIVSFVVAVVGTRWYLDATGYPQVGGGELHVAHMLWGGLLLVIAALLPLLFATARALTAAAILAGAGTGLFIDEVGKFITASNDYFYPLAAPLIYGLLLALVLLFLLVRRRDGAAPAAEAPGALLRWENAHIPRRRYRRLLALALGLTGMGWVLALVLYSLLDEATIRDLISAVVRDGGRIERPSEPVFYLLEVLILGASGALLLVGSVALALGREGPGTTAAFIGLVLALTGGAVVSLYVEQISAITTTLVTAALLGAVVHFRTRFPSPEPAA